MKLKIIASITTLLLAPQISANTNENKVFSMYYDGSDIAIDKNSPATVVAHNGNDLIAEIIIENSDKNKVSHIKYNKFTVDDEGIILNNEKSKAEFIINEIVNGPTSLLLGNIAVQGKAAHVVIANPNGITCDSCSFSNTLSETLASATVYRDNNVIAHYSSTSIIPASFYRGYTYTKISPDRGKVTMLNSRKIDDSSMYNKLTIISNGITIDNQLVSSKDVSLYNNYNVTHHLDNTFSESVAFKRALIGHYKYNKRPIPTTSFLKIGNKNSANSMLPHLKGSIHSDEGINIYAKNTQIDNYGELTSQKTHLSLSDNTSFKNHNFISTHKLTVDKDKTSIMNNTETGYIFHYLPYVFPHSVTASDISNNQINNDEKNRIEKLILDGIITDKGKINIFTLKHEK